MSGIIDNKKRVLDAILTNEGRRQFSSGEFRVEFYSFTDNYTIYRADVNSGSSDITNLIQLEASNLPQDAITFEANDAGHILPFLNQQGIRISDGKILSQSFVLGDNFNSGSLEVTTTLSSSLFASTADNLLRQSLENFKNLNLISSKDQLFEDDGFGVGRDEINFVIHDEKPIRDKELWTANINEVESLFNDIRLSTLPNFKYLPPVNKINDDNIDKTNYSQTTPYHLGNYPPWGQTGELTYDQIKFELNLVENLGYCKNISFDPTSKNNSLLIQVFENGFDKLKKLDVIDVSSINKSGRNTFSSDIFFIGKIYTDENNTHTFIHMFTLLFE